MATNELTLNVTVRRLRLVCSRCGRFLAHEEPEVVVEKMSSWRRTELTCDAHPGAPPELDITATEITVDQESRPDAP